MKQISYQKLLFFVVVVYLSSLDVYSVTFNDSTIFIYGIYLFLIANVECDYKFKSIVYQWNMFLCSTRFYTHFFFATCFSFVLCNYIHKNIKLQIEMKKIIIHINFLTFQLFFSPFFCFHSFFIAMMLMLLLLQMIEVGFASVCWNQMSNIIEQSQMAQFFQFWTFFYENKRREKIIFMCGCL